MSLSKKQDVDDFWREYEEKTGEKVLTRTLGQYISGWDEFDINCQVPLWGLVIVTSGGFRFHHFPRQNWLDSLFRSALSDTAKEKSFFLPKKRIITAVLHKEKKWWKKLLGPVLPVLTIRYFNDQESEKKLTIQADFRTDEPVENLLSDL